MSDHYFMIFPRNFTFNSKKAVNISNPGDKGEFREDALVEFLNKNRLPKRYGIGSGQIIGHVQEPSKSSDLVIFDQFEGVPLMAGSRKQVFPIETVYGIVEVKSHLSKEKLIEGLENIKSVKSLIPVKHVYVTEPDRSRRLLRPAAPFGFIFAYELANNSLDSLLKNLVEWENNNPPYLWPNLIIVLGRGLIYHVDKNGQPRISSDSIGDDCHPVDINFKEDTLFYFYAYLLDLCKVDLPKFQISNYYDLPKRVGDYAVKGHDQILKLDKNNKLIYFKLTSEFITKVVHYCDGNPLITQAELLKIRFNFIPSGLSDSQLHIPVHLYNPEKLKGISDTKQIIFGDDGQPTVDEPLIEPSVDIIVNGTHYCIPFYYIQPNDTERV